MKSYKSTKRHVEKTVETNDSNFVQQLKKNVKEEAKLASEDFFEQLLGLSSDQETKEKVVFELSKLNKSENKDTEKNTEKTPKPKKEIQPGIDYHKEYYESITKFAERASYGETSEQKKQIQQIMAELKKLVLSTKSLQAQFGMVTVNEAPSNPGKYYVNFFEWLLIMLRQARQKVEDSKSWLETVKGKNKKKMGYWDKAKKHGTSFSQANERFVATSTG